MSILNMSEECHGDISAERKSLTPCTIVIFGASGDLTSRKLIPALYHLFKEKQMPEDFRVVGFARREKTDESWRTELRTALNEFSRTKPVDDKVWHDFAKNISYCRGDLTETSAYTNLETMLASFGSTPLRENILFYLAISPSQFGEVVEQLHRTGLLNKEGVGWQRVVVEKPFGHDLASAQALNRELTRHAL
jgi:glucose-6-phosphate 1-dehydrogenase